MLLKFFQIQKKNAQDFKTFLLRDSFKIYEYGDQSKVLYILWNHLFSWGPNFVDSWKWVHSWGRHFVGQVIGLNKKKNRCKHRENFPLKIVAAFRGMHVSPAKYSSWSVTEGQTDRQTDRRTDDRQSDPYVPLCFAGDTKITLSSIKK